MSGQSSKDDILIFIMRHGEAEALLTDDKSRRLTEVGSAEIGASSRWLAESYCPKSELATALVSPYTRTRQSYQQVTNTLHASQFEICADITPDGNVKLAHDYVDLLARQSLKNNAGQPLLLVSHMPFVSFFLDEICEAPKMALFATGSVAVVRYWVDRSKGVLLQHYQGL